MLKSVLIAGAALGFAAPAQAVPGPDAAACSPGSDRLAQLIGVHVALPRPGSYAVAVGHDVDCNNKSGDWSDGGGASNNRRLSFFHVNPAWRDTAVNVGNGVKPVILVLNDRHGRSIGPVGSV